MGIPAQVSSSSLDHGSKLRGPSPTALVLFQSMSPLIRKLPLNPGLSTSRPEYLSKWDGGTFHVPFPKASVKLLFTHIADGHFVVSSSGRLLTPDCVHPRFAERIKQLLTFILTLVSRWSSSSHTNPYL
ncbi:hypothetical protein TNCV_747651 [Trichonephila clavipes]|nr:hypothetical protein TNCV_747651 [Trichonephila clavipes]